MCVLNLLSVSSSSSSSSSSPSPSLPPPVIWAPAHQPGPPASCAGQELLLKSVRDGGADEVKGQAAPPAPPPRACDDGPPSPTPPGHHRAVIGHTHHHAVIDHTHHRAVIDHTHHRAVIDHTHHNSATPHALDVTHSTPCTVNVQSCTCMRQCSHLLTSVATS